MKLSLKMVSLAAVCGALSFSGYTQQRMLTGAEAAQKVPGANLIRMGKYADKPAYIRLAQGKEIAFEKWQQWMSSMLKLDQQVSFTLLKADKDKLGHVHYRFQQRFNGVAVENGIWLVHTHNGMVYSMNGLVYGSLPAGSAVLTKAEALAKALRHIGAESYKWNMPAEEAHLKAETGNPLATYFPEGEMVYAVKGNNFSAANNRLAWKFNIYAHKPLYRAEVFVDAQTGAILCENHLLHDADVVGTAITAYSGTKSITSDSFGGGFRLRETGRGNGIRTYDMNTGTSYGGSVDFTDADNVWNNVNVEQDEVATDAHWGAEMTYDYYMLEHGRNSIDNAGFLLNSYVHYDVGYANAFWDGNRMTYGDGDGFYNPFTALDIAGHEITHGLTTFTADLVYQDESGALNESFSDIFGVAIDWYANPGAGNWLMGEDIGSAFRSMSNPNAYGDPDTYFGMNWAPLGGADNGGVHSNSGVQNFWFYLLCNGGAGTNDIGDGYTVTGIGMNNAADIAFRNLTVYLTNISEFEDARFYAIQSAIDLFGTCSPEVEATTNAWYAVGVGNEYVADVIADFNAPVVVGCSSPFMVNFNNLSNNASVFSWNFGDGGTSNAASPSHTYTSLGSYDVQLIADGGLCGIDTILMPNYITIDTSIACNINMPSSGIGATQTACSGNLYDSGGPTASYGADEDAQITISPVGAVSVDLTFSIFNVEPGPGTSCNYDYLRIYDGPNTASPLIGTYCNNNIPPTTVSSTGGSVTLVFHSDGGLELPGYEVGWSCNLSGVAPVANFTADDDSTCTGEVNFTDLSNNGPLTWSWDFGDGGTSSLQHPTHTYAANGLYTVQLVVTNMIGSNTVTRVDYIYVNMPAAPVVSGATICHDETANLTALATGGTLSWYNVPTGGSSIHTGASYTTPVLGVTTTYYVQNEVPSSPLFGGPEDNTFGGGGNFAGDQHLVFTAYTPFVLKSVLVYAQGAGNRTIQLRNSAGTVLQSAVVNIPNGTSRVILNFNVPAGTNLQLGTLNGSSPNLYRNSAGAVFPYTIPGVASITGTSATPGYYYFFYDWEVQGPPCASPRVPVTATVDNCTGLTDATNPLGIYVYPNPATQLVNITVADKTQERAVIEIRNKLGQVVWRQQTELSGQPVNVNIAHFSRGVYLVNVVAGEQRSISKLVVE